MNYEKHRMEILVYEDTSVECATSKGDGESTWSIRPDRSDG